MSYEELNRIQGKIKELMDVYGDPSKDDIYYEILDNISNTCSIKKSLLEIDRINCISRDKPIFDSDKIQELLLITDNDKKILEKYFPDSYNGIIPYFTNTSFIGGEMKNSGLSNLNNCESSKNQSGGRSKKKKMRSKRSKRRSKRR